MTIYLVTCAVNGKRYVGQTSVRLEDRWRQWVKSSRYRFDLRLCQAIREFGEYSFSIKVLCRCKKEEANDREIKFIDLYRADDPRYGFNRSPGGIGRVAFRLSEETRRRMSTARRGYRHLEETKRKIADGNRGKVRDNEQRKNISEGAKAGWARRTNRRQSSEHRQKISQARKRWWRNHGR